MKEAEKGRMYIWKALEVIALGLAIVAFWRGAWGLMDMYVFPNNLLLSFIVSLLTGILVLYLTKRLTKHLI